MRELTDVPLEYTTIVVYLPDGSHHYLKKGGIIQKIEMDFAHNVVSNKSNGRTEDGKVNRWR